jgi:hypothetical protein
MKGCAMETSSRTRILSVSAAVAFVLTTVTIGYWKIGLPPVVIVGGSSPGGIGTETRKGADSDSGWSPSVLTLLGDRAAAKNNELATSE